MHFERAVTWIECMRSILIHIHARKNAIQRDIVSYTSAVICRASSAYFLWQSKFVACERHENRNKRNAMYRKRISGGTSEATEGNQRWAKCATLIFESVRLRSFSLFFTILRSLLFTETKMVSPHATERIGTRVAYRTMREIRTWKNAKVVRLGERKKGKVPFPILSRGRGMSSSSCLSNPRVSVRRPGSFPRHFRATKSTSHVKYS